MHIIIHYLQLLDEIMSEEALKTVTFPFSFIIPIMEKRKMRLRLVKLPRMTKLTEWEKEDMLPGWSDPETFSSWNSPSHILQP